MPAIAALLIYIAYGLIDVRGFARLARLNRADFGVASITLAGMLFLPFQQAILIGAALALLLYLNRTAHPALRMVLPDPESSTRAFTAAEEFDQALLECPQLKLVRIEGSIYFGAAGHISQQLHKMRAEATQKHLLVMAKSMNHIDLAGADVWEQELGARRAMGGDLYFHRPRHAVRQVWVKTGFDVHLGSDNIFSSKAEAIKSIYARLDPRICASCSARIFLECQKTRGISDGGQQ
jgi:SulP family sulfate permease